LDQRRDRELHRIISASVRDMLDAYRLQAQAGPVSDQALEGIIFRAAHPVLDKLVFYPAEQRAALYGHPPLPARLEDPARVGGAAAQHLQVRGPPRH
jgi:hypothetical protein